MDAACTYIKNQATIDGVNRYFLEYSCCSGDRESSYLGSLLQAEIDSTRKLLKRFINAHEEDYIIFTASTTDGINKVISSLQENSEISTIIVSDLEHNSNFLPQREWSKKKGFDFQICPYKEVLDLVLLEQHLSSLGKGFLFCFTHSSNIIWWNFPIKAIASIVHKYHGYLLVDDAQFVSYHREDVIDNGIDFCVFSAHKLGGPTGIGVLCVQKDAARLLTYSQQLWWGTVREIVNQIPTYKDLPYFFEWGVQNFSWILGLKDCVEYIESQGMEVIQNYIEELSRYFFASFQKWDFGIHLEVISLPDSSVISMVPKTFNAIDFHQYTNYFDEEYIVAFRTGTMCADNFVNEYVKNKNIFRVSFGIYNTHEDIDIFFKVLGRYVNSIH